MNKMARLAGKVGSRWRLWLVETLIVVAAAALVPLWLWLPVSGYGWLALHVVLPAAFGLVLWLGWRLAARGFPAARRVNWLLLAAAAAAGALVTWGLLSVVPVFGSIALQTASFVIRLLAAAMLTAGLLLLPFAEASE